jgi:hypothetical protein
MYRPRKHRLKTMDSFIHMEATQLETREGVLLEAGANSSIALDPGAGRTNTGKCARRFLKETVRSFSIPCVPHYHGVPRACTARAIMCHMCHCEPHGPLCATCAMVYRTGHYVPHVPLCTARCIVYRTWHCEPHAGQNNRSRTRSSPMRAPPSIVLPLRCSS